MTAPVSTTTVKNQGPARTELGSKERTRRGRAKDPASRILELQRVAGNRAVNQLVQPGGGFPLTPDVRSFMEARFNHDFSRVRIHTNDKATASARSIHAAAYTVGYDIVFGPGRYAPRTTQGLHLLAHELTHVIQQSGATPASTFTLEPASGSYESQARAASSQVMMGEPLGSLTALSVQAVQRQSEEAAEGEESLSLRDRIAQRAITAAAQRTARIVSRASLMPIPESVLAAVLAAEASFLFRSYQRLVQQGGAMEFIGRVRELLDLETAAAFVGRFIWGLLKGLVSPITGLVHLAVAGVRFQAGVIEWINQQAQRAPELIAEAQGLGQAFENFKNAAEQAFGNLRQRERLIEFASAIFATASQAGAYLRDQLVRVAARKGREAADSLVNSLLRTPLPELAELAGEIIGVVVIEIVLLLFTEGIGNLITKVGEFARALRPLSRGTVIITEVAIRVGRVIAEVEHVIGALLNRTVLRPFQPLFEALTPLLARMRSFVSRLFGFGERAAVGTSTRAAAGLADETLESGTRAAERIGTETPTGTAGASPTAQVTPPTTPREVPATPRGTTPEPSIRTGESPSARIEPSTPRQGSGAAEPGHPSQSSRQPTEPTPPASPHTGEPLERFPGTTGTRHLPREFRMPTRRSRFPETRTQMGTPAQRQEGLVRPRGERVGPGEVGTQAMDVPGGRSGLREHWQQHGNEFPEFRNARQYQEGAIEFCRDPSTRRFYYRFGPEGRPTIGYYNMETGTFASTSVDGETIFTFMRPGQQGLPGVLRASRMPHAAEGAPRVMPPGATPRHSVPFRRK